MEAEEEGAGRPGDGAAAPATTDTASLNWVPQLADAEDDKEEDDASGSELDAQALAALLEARQSTPVRVLEELRAVEEAVPVVGPDEARARADEDAFFMVDASFPVRKFQAWRSSSLFPRARPFMAVKCCPNPILTAALASLPGHACGFDCASIAELELVLGQGVPPNRIIFANPVKTPEALAFALHHGVRTMTFDSAPELHKIAQELVALRSRPSSSSSPSPSLIPEPELVLRLRVPDEHSDVPLGEKYGAPPEACAGLLDTSLALGLRVVGVSFHCGSGSHSADAFCTAVRLAREAFDLAASKGLRLRLLDIGGGWPGWDGVTEDAYRARHEQQQHQQEGGKDGEKGAAAAAAGAALPLSCHDIARAVSPLLDTLFPPSLNGGLTIIAEPGRYFVEGSHVLFAQVCDRRWVDSDGAPIPPPGNGNSNSNGGGRGSGRVAYVIGEGVMGCMKDILLCGESFHPKPLRVVASSCRASSGGVADGDEEQRLYESLVVGPSGEAFDVVAPSARLPLLEAGDWVFFERVGAYTASIAAVAISAVHDPAAQPYAYVATRVAVDDD